MIFFKHDIPVLKETPAINHDAVSARPLGHCGMTWFLAVGRNGSNRIMWDTVSSHIKRVLVPNSVISCHIRL